MLFVIVIFVDSLRQLLQINHDVENAGKRIMISASAPSLPPQHNLHIAEFAGVVFVGFDLSNWNDLEFIGDVHVTSKK